MTSDVSLAETAEAAELFGSDGLIVTGTATGMEADPEEVKGDHAYLRTVPVKGGTPLIFREKKS